jgi:hypothetical protein
MLVVERIERVTGCQPQRLVGQMPDEMLRVRQARSSPKWLPKQDSNLWLRGQAIPRRQLPSRGHFQGYACVPLANSPAMRMRSATGGWV